MKLEAVIALEDREKAEQLKEALLAHKEVKTAETADTPGRAEKMISSGKYNAVVSSLMFTEADEAVHNRYVSKLNRRRMNLEEDLLQGLANGKMPKRRILYTEAGEAENICSQCVEATPDIAHSLVQLTLSEEEKTRLINELVIYARKAMNDQRQRFAYGLDIIERAYQKGMKYLLLLAPPEEKSPFFIEHHIRKQLLAWMLKQKLLLPAEAYDKDSGMHFNDGIDPERVYESLLLQKQIQKGRYIIIPANWNHLNEIMNIGIPFYDNKETIAKFAKMFSIAREAVPISGEDSGFSWEINGNVYIRNNAICFDAILVLRCAEDRYLGKKAVFHIGKERYSAVIKTKMQFAFPDPHPQQNFTKSEVIGIELV